MDKNQADSLLIKGQYNDAIIIYSKLLEDCDISQHFNILSNRSLAYFKIEDYIGMKNDSIQCIKLNPNSSKSWGRLGGALFGLTKYKESLDAYTKANSIMKNKIYDIMINKIYNKMLSCGAEMKLIENENFLNYSNKLLPSLEKFMSNNREILSNGQDNIENKLFENSDIMDKIMQCSNKINLNDISDKIKENPFSIINDKIFENLIIDILENVKL